MTDEERERAEGPEATERAAAAEDAAAAAEPPAEPEVRRQRQWVTLRNASMDVRGGLGICGSVAHDLRSAVGRPHDCALVYEAPVAPELVGELHRDLADQGFTVHALEMPPGGCDLDRVGALDAQLAGAGVTADDLVVAVGGYEALSVASFSCSSWCGGVSLAEVPTDVTSALLAGPTPRALDLPGLPRMVAQDGSARFSILDVGLYDLDPAGEGMRTAFALMAATAMADNAKAFERLWDAADDLLAGDVTVTLTQLMDTVKSRGRIVSSTAVATRQSIAYGQDLARALAGLVGPQVPASSMLADGLRFAARLAVAEGALSVDDMLTQDELLERLGLGTVEAAVDPDALVAAIRAERFRRTRRFMVAIPRAIGRVRLAMVDDALLAEHAAAWCASRPA